MNYTVQTIDELLERFRAEIGQSFQIYRNHVYRVYLNCLLMDADPANSLKYAIASVFHDIGIWTDNTFDYLQPSINQAKQYLQESGKEDWTEEISAMIYWHHKISRYEGEHGHVVESFRKADWIDVSFGLQSYGADRTRIRENLKNIPSHGFHRFLLKQSLAHFFRKPLNPLPMFKS